MQTLDEILSKDQADKEIARRRSVTPFFWAKRPLPPPPQKTASAAKPILACLYKTLTMGARRSCGQLSLARIFFHSSKFGHHIFAWQL